ncbi:MAG: hypothetical protein AB2532_02825, partial [Candidatus Thiodiazotropha sp.]
WDASCQVVDSNRLFAPTFDPWVNSPLAGEGEGEGYKSVSEANSSIQNSKFIIQNFLNLFEMLVTCHPTVNAQ